MAVPFSFAGDGGGRSVAGRATEHQRARIAPISATAFIRHEAFGGILLIVSAVVAFVWANSAWHGSYEDLWNTELTLGTVRFNLTETLLHWVNDGLMAIFFFVVGLEIKREVLVGELASPRRAPRRRRPRGRAGAGRVLLRDQYW